MIVNCIFVSSGFVVISWHEVTKLNWKVRQAFVVVKFPPPVSFTQPLSNFLLFNGITFKLLFTEKQHVVQNYSAGYRYCMEPGGKQDKLPPNGDRQERYIQGHLLS